ncbi:MAG: TonB-dependent receptor, partial [Chitinophagaceae bacterium]
MFCAFFILLPFVASSQGTITGTVSIDGKALPGVNVSIKAALIFVSSDASGNYEMENIPVGTHTLEATFVGMQPMRKSVTIKDKASIRINFELKEDNSLEEVVITGTLKAVTRSESAVPVEIYSTAFFKKNPTANIFEGLQTVNGVRPQFNCNICNTGDIHINGLEGPYTLVLIDGMPIVSGLSTVYGLSGIPNSMIDRIEIVKGPASSLYGSEAVGGLINIITKNPKNAALFTADAFSTSWGEVNTDVSLKVNPSDKISIMTGINYFNYSNRIDNNGDNFTDVTLQDRVSIFQKYNVNRSSGKLLSIMARYFYEDRWGGEMNWNKTDRGSNRVYGESIYTNRWELIGSYELPLNEKMLLNFSYTNHDQDSFYGVTPYLAQQRIGFTQLTWDKKKGRHDMLFGAAFRYQFYNDNTPATIASDVSTIPGVFAQDEIRLSQKHHLLLGARYDYNSRHGSIFTP